MRVPDAALRSCRGREMSGSTSRGGSLGRSALRVCDSAPIAPAPSARWPADGPASSKISEPALSLPLQPAAACSSPLSLQELQ